MKKFGLYIHNFKKYLRPKISNLSVLAIFLYVISLTFQVVSADLDPSNYATGAIPLTEEQINDIEENWPRVLAVRPNKYGAARMQEAASENGLALMSIEATSDNEEEFITNKNSTVDTLSKHRAAMGAAALPRSVDNSKLPCFPPIGNQKSQGSCVAWASTYYHATHEYGLLNGINNKTSSKGIRSPKWTYNMINWGKDTGSYPTDAYALLKSNGAPAHNDFPYDTNFREWDLKTQDWISALSYRMGDPSFITIKGPADIDVVKQILNNGHLVTFLTYASSWQFSQVLADPSQASNPYAGQRAISWMNGASGGHHVTIVGYNDDIWIDVNRNGKVDQGEKGAFLMANSWGTGWANGGYIWISYDAFLKTSMVPNGPSTNRRQIAQTLFSVVPKSPNYKPKAVAKFSLSQAVRNQLKISLGASSTTATIPASKFISAALTQDGGAYAFNGQSPTLQTGTFALDMTDLLPKTNIAQKYYLILQDTTSGNKTTLNSYSVLDLINNKEVSLTGTPLSCDGSTIQPSIVYQPSSQPDPVKPEINITSPANLATIKGTISVNANINENVKVAKVEFHVDNVLAGIDLNAPFVLSLDTTKFSNGQHTISAAVYDLAGNTANDEITVNIQNPESTGFPAYLTFQLNKESGWVTGAQYNATIKNTGTKTITDLKIKFHVPLTNINLWNVSVVASDTQSVTFGFPSWVKSLASGEVLSFGFVIKPEMQPKVSFVSAVQA